MIVELVIKGEKFKIDNSLDYLQDEFDRFIVTAQLLGYYCQWTITSDFSYLNIINGQNSFHAKVGEIWFRSHQDEEGYFYLNLIKFGKFSSNEVVTKENFNKVPEQLNNILFQLGEEDCLSCSI